MMILGDAQSRLKNIVDGIILPLSKVLLAAPLASMFLNPPGHFRCFDCDIVWIWSHAGNQSTANGVAGRIHFTHKAIENHANAGSILSIANIVLDSYPMVLFNPDSED